MHSVGAIFHCSTHLKTPCSLNSHSFQFPMRKSEHSAPVPMLGSQSSSPSIQQREYATLLHIHTHTHTQQQQQQQQHKRSWGSNPWLNGREATRTTRAFPIPGSVSKVRGVLNCIQFAMWTNCHWRQQSF